MLKLGLTGGIGSGKSTVAQSLAQRGAFLIDADAQSRALTAPGGEALPDIARALGAHLIDVHGALDRNQLRERVFSDPRAKAQLEEILHPRIAQRMAALQDQAQQLGAVLVVYDIPLLLESKHWRRALDRVLVVDCDADTQIQRVQQRSGLDAAAVRRIMDNQLSRWQRLQGADDVLFNGAGVSLTALNAEVAQWAAWFGL